MRKITFIMLGIWLGLSGLAHAKAMTEQDKIIAINDASASMQEENPTLSKSLGMIAQERQEQWDASGHKDQPPYVEADRAKDEAKILLKAAAEIKQVYPLIAQSLTKIAQELDGTPAKK